MRRQFVPYRRELKPRSQSLRRDPSPAERKLWFEFLRELPVKFTRQKPLGHYIADFYCASRQLIIEVDGDSHYTDCGQRYDAARTARLELEGIRVVRVTNLEVMQEFEGACQRIRDALARIP
ncbi:MAG TPA: endonuclease domain-containing protein [Burkholderiales bacterium]|nr:endonuclease domain-containing protein [Burkholderiales bacterium]